MNEKTKRFVLLLFAMAIFGSSLWAQQATPFSIKEAVAYAKKNNLLLQRSRIDETIANKKVNEIFSLGLPQVSAGVGYTNNLQVATQKLPNFINAGLPAGLPKGPDFVDAQFGVRHNLVANMQLSQLLFDGTYFLGVKAAKEFVKISQYQTDQTEIDVEVNTIKTYYAVLMAKKRIELISNSMQSLDSTLFSLRALAKEGFAEMVDTARVSLSLANLTIQKARLEDQHKIMLNMLKLQMGFDVSKPIELTESTESLANNLKAYDVSGNGNLNSRPEFKLLDQQVKLGILDKRRFQMGYLPTLSGTFTHLQNTFAPKGQADQLANLWFPGTSFGISLQVPIFSGFRQKSLIQQASLRLQQYQLSQKLFEQSFQTDVYTAQTNYLRAADNFNLQKKNVDLANEIRRIAKIKFQEGLGTSLEYTTAETESNASEANVIIALYELMIAELDYRKATGAKIIE